MAKKPANKKPAGRKPAPGGSKPRKAKGQEAPAGRGPLPFTEDPNPHDAQRQKVKDETTAERTLGTRPRGEPGKLKEGFSKDTSQRLITLLHERQSKRADRSDLRREVKTLKGTISETDEAIRKAIDAEEAQGRDGKKEAFSLEASNEIVTRKRVKQDLEAKVSDIKGRIKDLNDGIREAMNEADRTVAAEDPSDNLWAGAKADDGSGHGNSSNEA
jgi:hypothetical protein